MFRFLLIVSILTLIDAKLVEVKCPSYCKCDIYEEYRRAVCHNSKLVVLESEIPSETEILDLSFNQISKLDINVFHEENLLSLRLLNISHNKVSQIHMNAFEGLNNLKTLDLSYNAMQYILLNWFWSLPRLSELYLRGNGFSILPDGPLIESKSLKILDLSACHINFINNDTFIKLPNLEKIDLSENLMQQIDVAAITPLKNLQIFDVKNSSMICTTVTEKLAKYCEKNGIRFQNPCKIVSLNSQQMERMVLQEDPPDEKNSWIYDDAKECNTVQPTIIECNYNQTINTHRAGFLSRLIEFSPILAISVTFFYGIITGLIIACSFLVKARPRRPKEPKANNFDLSYKSFFKPDMLDEEDDALVVNESLDSRGTTPVAQRKLQIT